MSLLAIGESKTQVSIPKLLNNTHLIKIELILAVYWSQSLFFLNEIFLVFVVDCLWFSVSYLQPYSHSGYDSALWSALSDATSYQYVCRSGQNRTAATSLEMLPSPPSSSIRHDEILLKSKNSKIEIFAAVINEINSGETSDVAVCLSCEGTSQFSGKIADYLSWKIGKATNLKHIVYLLYLHFSGASRRCTKTHSIRIVYRHT